MLSSLCCSITVLKAPIKLNLSHLWKHSVGVVSILDSQLLVFLLQDQRVAGLSLGWSLLYHGVFVDKTLHPGLSCSKHR